MTAFAGIWRWDGQPLDHRRLAARVASIELDLNVEATTTRPLPGLVLHAAPLAFDRWSATERQPHVFGMGSVVTWNGRLDNREDLLVTLRHELSSDLSDVAIVAAGYRRWNDDVFSRLVGDWSVALWDAVSQTIHLACDYQGARPLYYADLDGGVAWGTRLSSMVRGSVTSPPPDEKYVLGALLNLIPPDRTPYSGINRLRSGHVLRASPTIGITLRRHSTLRPGCLRYRDPRDYMTEARELLTSAVRTRLRATGTVYAELSGGWDSSSVVCLAHSLIAAGSADAASLQPVSVLSSDALESDERHFIAAVERWCGLHTLPVEYCGDTSISELLAQRTYIPNPHQIFTRVSLSAIGRGVLLHGSLGDHVMLRMVSPFAMLEPLHAGHPLRTLRLYRHYARIHRRPLLRSLLNFVAAAYAPGLRDTIRAWRSFHSPAPRHRLRAIAIAAGVHHSLLMCLPWLQRHSDSSLNGIPRFQRPLVEHMYHSTTSDINSDKYPAVHMTDPYGHRPLVEHMLALPMLEFWDPNAQRVAMRRMLVDVLPPEILHRASKGTPAYAFNQARRRHADRLRSELPLLGPIERWELVRRAYIAIGAIRAAVEQLQKTDSIPLALSRYLPLEAWLRTVPSLMSHDGDNTSRSRAPIQVHAVAARVAESSDASASPLA